MVTVAQIEAEVSRLASENPDFVYQPPEGLSADEGQDFCFYVHRDANGNPIKGQGCIIGQALAALGIEVDENWEGNSAASVVEHYTRCLSDEARYLNRVQRRQDHGQPWGVAVDGLIRRGIPNEGVYL